MGDEKRLTCPNGHPLFGYVTGGVCGVCGAAYGETKSLDEAGPGQIVLETKEHGRIIAGGGGGGAA